MREAMLMYITDFQLRCRIFSSLIKTDIHFYEAFDEKEIFLKQTYLGSRLGLFVFQYSEQNLELVKKMKEEDVQIRYLMIIDEYKIKYIDLAAAAGIQDLLVLPYEEKEFMRKIISLIPKPDEVAIRAEVGSYAMIEEEIKRSVRGLYPLSFIMLDVIEITDVEKMAFQQRLINISKSTDSILYWEGSLYMLIYPFISGEELPALINNIKEVFSEVENTYFTERDLLIFGTTFPDDVKNAEEILRELEEGIENLKFSQIGRYSVAASRENLIAMMRRITKTSKESSEINLTS